MKVGHLDKLSFTKRRRHSGINRLNYLKSIFVYVIRQNKRDRYLLWKQSINKTCANGMQEILLVTMQQIIIILGLYSRTSDKSLHSGLRIFLFNNDCRFKPGYCQYIRSQLSLTTPFRCSVRHLKIVLSFLFHLCDSVYSAKYERLFCQMFRHYLSKNSIYRHNQMRNWGTQIMWIKYS